MHPPQGCSSVLDHGPSGATGYLTSSFEERGNRYPGGSLGPLSPSFEDQGECQSPSSMTQGGCTLVLTSHNESRMVDTGDSARHEDDSWRAESTATPVVSYETPACRAERPTSATELTMSACSLPGAQDSPQLAETEPTSQGGPSRPDQPTREGDMLVVRFPVPKAFFCTEGSCKAAYSSTSWTSQRQSLQRHLEQEHRIMIKATQNVCSICRRVLGTRPTSHRCIAGAVRSQQPLAAAQRHRCDECEEAFPSRKGLDNHKKRHCRDTARMARVSALPAAGTSTPGTRTSSATRPEPSREPDPVELPGDIVSAEPPRDPAPGELEASFPTAEPAPDEGGSNIALSGSVGDSANPIIDEITLSGSVGDGANSITDEITFSGSVGDTANPTTDEPERELPPLDASRAQPESSYATQVTTDQDHTEHSATACPPDVTSRPAASADPDPGEDDYPLAVHLTAVLHLQSLPETPESWSRFQTILAEATEVAAKTVKLPDQTKQDGPRRPINPEDPRAIQRLYRRNRRQAVRLITDGQSPRCAIPSAEVEAHFRGVWELRRADTSLLVEREPAGDELPLDPMTEHEVLSKARRCENTAPGDDRLTYHHWLAVDPGCRFLAAAFNICLQYRAIPDSWRQSRTILVPKKGDPAEITSWRPISLLRTASKLFSGVLAARLQAWLLEHDVLSRTQKGFLPYDGVFEHNYVLQRRMDEARTTSGDLCAAFLDFSNAFGCVPHNAIVDAVRGVGAGEAFAELVQDMYYESSSSVVTNDGCTDPIPMRCGIRQGCPLSGLLFNLVVDPVIRKVQGTTADHRILAYADDLTPLARDPASLQASINLIEEEAGRLGLSLNAAKCRSLHLSGCSPVGLRGSQFLVNGTPIPVIRDFEAFAYLGRPVGFNILQDGSDVDATIQLGTRILGSMLAPWQRLDAIKTFLYPALHHLMRTGTVGKTEWARLDEALRPLIKQTLYLPPGASNDYIYGSSRAGACGIPCAAETSDVCRVDSVFKLLTSRDPEVARMALDDLMGIVKARLRRDCDLPDAELYLSGHNEGDFRMPATQLRSVWTEGRKASGRLNVAWELGPEGASITVGSQVITPRGRSKVMHSLRFQLAQLKDARLHALPNQGKVMECVAADPAGSHFIRTGLYTRFADWRFIHRARLNLLPLNGAQPWRRGSDQRCRRCGFASETLPHVLNHCMRQSQAITQRHNNVVERVKKASAGRFTLVSENAAVGDTQLRPDLVLVRGEEAVVVDVCIPFENRKEALVQARRTKEEKYRPVIDHLRRRYQRVTVEAVVVGALGSWDPANDRFLKKLCSRSYLKRMKQMAASDTIRASRDIYAAHIAGPTR